MIKIIYLFLLYLFILCTLSCSFSARDIKRQSLDWLILMYADGEAPDIQYNIFCDINEAEKGLSLIQDENGNPFPSYDSVAVAVLWDPFTNAYTGTTVTSLYQLGRDASSDYNANTVLSAHTKDCTSDVSWLNGKDVDMSDPQTLTLFLKWAQSTYDAKHTILVCGDHGGGPAISEGRSMFYDYTSDRNSFMSIPEVASSLKAASYGINNKLDMMLLDVCFGSTIEEAYEYRDFVNYYLASIEKIPNAGSNYTKILQQFTSGITLVDVNKKIVNEFSLLYQGYSFWKPTFSSYDLEKITAIKNSLNSFASLVLDESKAWNTLPYEYKTALKKYFSYIPDTTPYRYKAVYRYLFDIEYAFNEIRNDVSTHPEFSELTQACDAVITSMNATIIKSWKKDASDAFSNLGICGVRTTSSIPESENLEYNAFAFLRDAKKWAELLFHWDSL